MNSLSSGVLEVSYVSNAIRVVDERIVTASFWHYKLLISCAMRDGIGPKWSKIIVHGMKLSFIVMCISVGLIIY